MAQVYNVEDETGKTGEIVLSLLGVLLEDAGQEQLEGLSQLGEVDDSEEFQDVKLFSLTHEQFRKSGHHIEDEEPGQVVVTDGGKLLVGSGSLDEVQDDLDEVDDVNGKFDVL